MNYDWSTVVDRKTVKHFQPVASHCSTSDPPPKEMRYRTKEL